MTQNGKMTSATRMASEPQLGIFWMVACQENSMLVADAIPLSSAESYGDCLTYPYGHHEVWTQWQRLAARELIARSLPLSIKSHEYDAIPRGRVVYERLNRHFIIYADRKLFASTVVRRIVYRFELLQENWIVRSDSHYCT